MEMEASWCRLLTSIKRYIISRRRANGVFKYFNTSIKSIKKRCYLFIKTTISHTILFTLFGKGCKFVKDLVVHDTNSTTVLHIWLARKLQDIFKMANENGGLYQHNCHKYELAGKVHYTRHGISKYGFVIDETQNHLEVRRSDDVIEMVLKMKYDSNKNHIFKYNGDRIAYNEYYVSNALDADEFYFSNVCPICILISKKKHVEKNFKILVPFYFLKKIGNKLKIQPLMSSYKFVYYVLCLLIFYSTKEK